MLDVVNKDKTWNLHTINDWLVEHPLESIHVDCTTAVMLKILDGKCKMDDDEKAVVAIIYNAVKERPGELLGQDIHLLINKARTTPEDDVLELVYEQRLYAEQMISRPVMKAYKAMLRQHGLIG